MGHSGTESTAARIQQAFYEQDEARLAKCIEEYLRQTVSFFDTTDEIFYHGLVLGFIAILNNRYFVRSNRESGEGRFDIQLIPKNGSLPGILMEPKVSKDENADLHKLAEDALLQIRKNRCETEMVSREIKNIFQYGAAFRKKDVEILLKNCNDRRRTTSPGRLKIREVKVKRPPSLKYDILS